MELRRYQSATIDAARDAYRRGSRAICIVLPTGAGKTFTAVQLVSRALARGGRVLWVVHRAELIRQAADAIRRAGVEPGIIAPWAEPRESTIQVASIQTLLARGERPPATVLVWDETHHVVASTYVELANHYSGALRLGLTATPERGDGVGLGNVFDSLVAVVQPRHLIASGHLVPARVVAPPPGRRKSLANHPASAYLELAPRRKAIVFAASVEHARKLAQSFRAAGVAAESIDGKVDDDERVAILGRFARDETRVLTNCAVLTEGFDCPNVDCVILARGFSSAGTYLQAVGRALRPAPGKSDALVIDLKGSSREHGLPDEDREYSLEGRAIRSAAGLDPIRQCPECGAVFRAGLYVNRTCPACGYQTKGQVDPAIRRAALACLSAKDTQDDRVAFLRTEIAKARHMKKKDGTPYKAVGYAIQRFRVKYRRFPEKELIEAAIRPAVSPAPAGPAQGLLAGVG